MSGWLALPAANADSDRDAGNFAACLLQFLFYSIIRCIRWLLGPPGGRAQWAAMHDMHGRYFHFLLCVKVIFYYSFNLLIFKF